jgi:hypothetical protein
VLWSVSVYPGFGTVSEVDSPYPFIVQGQVFHVVYMQTNWGVINMSFCCKVGINIFVCSIYFQLNEKNTFGVILCAKTCAQ